MIFLNDQKLLATAWKVDKHDKYLELQISTSEKNQDGSYTNSYWYPRAIGHAFNTLKDVEKGTRITITKAKLTNTVFTDKDGKKRTGFKFLILEADISGQRNEASTPVTEIETQTEAVSDQPW
ncbi:MAG: hypothetical protein K6C34_05685 [Alphaproteobacteria bacterium]|nr:hypothetical protein [Alphaproteobacteria bacterium]